MLIQWRQSLMWQRWQTTYSQLSCKQPPLVHDKVVAYKRWLSTRKIKIINPKLNSGRDRVNAEIVHFYAEKIQKMHFQNFNASWDAGRLFVLDHFILNKTKRSEVEISRPQSEVEISWPPYWNEQRRRLGTILKHPGVLHAYPPFWFLAPLNLDSCVTKTNKVTILVFYYGIEPWKTWETWSVFG